MQKTLLVLAAGMGSRYGGLKQMEGFGPSGETILEYSIYDAYKAGFEKTIFVIRRSISDDFQKRVLDRLPSIVQYEICYQELECLPAGYSVPEGRVKPWGTGHAVWVARDHINGPFCIVNGDDFYGRGGFQKLANYFDNHAGREHAMVAYPLGRTLSDSGSVSRGICLLDESGNLKSMSEVTAIVRKDGKICSNTGEGLELQEDTPASMNLFGLQPSILKVLDEDFHRFLKTNGGEQKSEFYIPKVVGEEIGRAGASVHVLSSEDDWMGVTNPEDRQEVVDGIQALVTKGVYPTNLWSEF